MARFDYVLPAAMVVTGAASGIGRAVALEAAAQGIAVVALDVDRAGAASVAEECEAQGVQANAYTVDVSREQDVAAVFRDVADESGDVTHLVNNAAPRSAERLPFDEGVAKTLCSVETVTTAALARWRESLTAVVNVASISGTSVGGNVAWYEAAKSGVASYTRYLAVAHAGRPRANAVAPGFVDTPRAQRLFEHELGQEWLSRVPLGRAGTAAEVASAVVFLASPAASYVNGATLVVDGALSLRL